VKKKYGSGPAALISISIWKFSLTVFLDLFYWSVEREKTEQFPFIGQFGPIRVLWEDTSPVTVKKKEEI